MLSASAAVVGCICGSDYTMLMGAMVMGPLAGWVIKQFDKKVEGHIPAGFEMLINNFSVGILGMLLAIRADRRCGLPCGAQPAAAGVHLY